MVASVAIATDARQRELLTASLLTNTAFSFSLADDFATHTNIIDWVRDVPRALRPTTWSSDVLAEEGE